MSKKYSIAEARNRFAALVHEVEQSQPVEITRRGQSVAVLLSVQEYERITGANKNFWDAYRTFRKKYAVEPLDVEPELFQVRTREPGRDVEL